MTRIEDFMEDCKYSCLIEDLKDEKDILALQLTACWAINNYVRFGQNTADSWMKQAHARLFDGQGDKEPGQARSKQVFVGSHIPPKPEIVQIALDSFRPHIKDIPPTQAHYIFEQIHPFMDGNGRIGRLMIPILHMMRPRSEKPVFYSKYIFQNRKEYYESFESEEKMVEFLGKMTEPLPATDKE